MHSRPLPRISQTLLYDEKGSALYEKIVEQKEYALALPPHRHRCGSTGIVRGAQPPSLPVMKRS